MKEVIKLEANNLKLIVEKILKEYGYKGFKQVTINDNIKSELSSIELSLSYFKDAANAGDFDSLNYQMTNILTSSENILKELRNIEEINR